ncbi:hypothetical protein [Dermabacter jinjuensis]|uniref:Uncharacterized protein n=1 Tax=Dermabacter jinjuensis TaxID=1667168 RepID=A0ABN5DLF3_9MICO|nr:hypothetical protein [Dermabacter jinjuensis]ATH95865.1 hypothetical protein COP05_01230 [Dermabacter jinjuensis]UEB89924.1 hypothetical protein LK448_10700 [Dermabacter jinjuensis]
MPGKTPNGIPYVLPNDTIATFPTVSKQIAEAVDKSRELVGAWIPLTLTGGWEPLPRYGNGPYSGLRIRKVPQGMQIDGAVKSTREYNVIAELPKGFTPKNNSFVPVFDSKGVAFIACNIATSTGAPGITFIKGPSNGGMCIISGIVPLD